MVDEWERGYWCNKNSICHIKEEQQFCNPKRNGELMALDKLFETLNFLKNKIYTSFQRLSTGLISDFDILINEVFFGALENH